MVLSMSNKHEAAAEQFEKAVALNPRLFEAYYFYARASVAQGKYLKAAKLYKQAIEVRPEDYQMPLLIPQVYRSLGRLDDASRAYHMGVERGLKHLELNPDDVRALYLVGGALCEINRPDEGLKMIDRAVAIAPHDAGMLYNVACNYSKLDRPDEALDFLERSVQIGRA